MGKKSKSGRTFGRPAPDQAAVPSPPPKPPEEAPQPAAQPKQPKKKKPQVHVYGGENGRPMPPPPKEKVVHRCGHAFTPFDVSTFDCPTCTREAIRKRKQKERERRDKRVQEATRLTGLGHVVVLLPEGTKKKLEWRGGRVVGHMHVPGHQEAFFCAARTERECCHGLHALYVEWLARQKSITGKLPITPPTEPISPPKQPALDDAPPG